MAAIRLSRQSVSAPVLRDLTFPEDRPTTSEDSDEAEEEEEQAESIAATRPRREPKAPQSLYIAPTELRKRKVHIDADASAELNKRRRGRHKRARDSREPQGQEAANDEVLAEAEHDDYDEADESGRGGFMAASRSKRRKSLFGARRRHRRSDGSTYADNGADDTDSDRESVDTHSDDERRQDDDDHRRRRGMAASNEPRIVIHVRVRVKPGRDAGGKFCGIRKYKLDRITGIPGGLPSSPPSKQHRQSQPQQQPHRNGYSSRHRPHGEFEPDDGRGQNKHAEHSDDDNGKLTTIDSFLRQRERHDRRQQQLNLADTSRAAIRSAVGPAHWQPAWPTRAGVYSSGLPRAHDTSSTAMDHDAQPDAKLEVDSQGNIAWPGASNYAAYHFDQRKRAEEQAERRDDMAHLDEQEVMVKKELVEAGAAEEEQRERARQMRSASVGVSASTAASAATTRSAYAQHGLTNATNDHSYAHTSRHDSSLLSPSRRSFDRADAFGPYVPPPPPATFPPSPPASPPAQSRVMLTMRSMPSLEYDIANVRAGIHPLYLSALEQIDRLRIEREHGVERMKHERLQHVDDLHVAEMKQVEEEWKDEARGLQQRIIDQLTTQHRHSAYSPNSASAATARTTRRRHMLTAGSRSKAVLKRYHAEYCLPAVERRADVDKCRRLIEELMGDEEGADLLRRVDERIERRKERTGAWKRHTRELQALGSDWPDDSARAVSRAWAAAQRTRGSNGRFQ